MADKVRGTALRSWLGEPSITERNGVQRPNNGHITSGDIVHLDTKDAIRKTRQGLFRPAVEPAAAKAAPVPENKMAPEPPNKESAGPFPGGQTGKEPAPLSSAGAPALAARELRQPSRRRGRGGKSASSQ
jgi:hypothetical protein